MRLVTYNMGQGGSRNLELRKRLFAEFCPDILFVQESRDPALSWLSALMDITDAYSERLLWTVVPGGKWGSGLWIRRGRLTPLPVPDDFSGRVVAAVIDGLAWPGIGVTPVVALSIHAPTRKNSSYLKEVGRILDFANVLAEGRPMILAGDFNVVVGMRDPSQPIGISRGERLLLERLRDEFKLVPCWQTAHPGEPLARTLRWLNHFDSLPYHCDGLFVPAAWANAVSDCSVLESAEWCTLSDHNPVVATLNNTPASV